ncbi:MAG: hypothetical protein ACLQIB_23595 [Isosphaeraceae bacterium]
MGRDASVESHPEVRDHTMRMIMRKGFGLLGAGLVALSLAAALPAAYPTPTANSAEAQSCVQRESVGEVDDAQKGGTKRQDGDREGASSAQLRSAPAVDSDRDHGVQLEAIPGIDRLIAASSFSGGSSVQNAKADTDDPPLPREIPKYRFRTTSVLPLSKAISGNFIISTTPDNHTRILCKARVQIISASPRFGMIDVEADEIAITRNRTEDGPRASHNAMWVDDYELPMEMHFKGNVVLRHDRNGAGGFSERRIIRAEKLEYDFVLDQLEAIDVVILTVGVNGSSSFEATQIKLSGFLTQERDQSRPAD